MYVNFIHFIHRGLVKKNQRVIIYDTKCIQFKCFLSSDYMFLQFLEA